MSFKMLDKQLEELRKKQLGVIFDPLKKVKAYPHPSDVINTLTGSNVGGLLIPGRLVEIFGSEGCGKTTLAMEACSGLQEQIKNKTVKGGGCILYIDTEQRFHADYAKALYLNIDNETFMVVQPKTGEEAWDIIENLIIKSKNKAKVKAIVLDSVASTLPKEMLVSNPNGEGGQKALHATFFKTFSYQLNALASTYDIAVLLINQLRQVLNMGNPYSKSIDKHNVGTGYTSSEEFNTTGGIALKFYLSQRWHLCFVKRFPIPVLNDKGTVLRDGKGRVFYDKEKVSIINMANVKNSLSAPYRKADIAINYGIGTDDRFVILNLFIDKGYTDKATPNILYSFDKKSKIIDTNSYDMFIIEYLKEGVMEELFSLYQQIVKKGL